MAWRRSGPAGVRCAACEVSRGRAAANFASYSNGLENKVVTDLCPQHARKADWAEFVPAMRNRVIRFEVVDEAEWKARLNALLAG